MRILSVRDRDRRLLAAEQAGEGEGTGTEQEQQEQSPLEGGEETTTGGEQTSFRLESGSDARRLGYAGEAWLAGGVGIDANWWSPVSAL